MTPTLRRAGPAHEGRPAAWRIRRRSARTEPRAAMMDTVETDLETLARDIDGCCRIRGTFTLRSGQVTDEYFDKYLFESDPRLLARVVAAMAPLLPADVDLVGGLELGGIPIVTMLSALTGLPALFVRKEAKTYGTLRQAEGGDPRGRTVVLVEDVITTGGAVIDAATALRRLGTRVEVVVCAIDRRPADATRLAAAGIEVRAVLTRADLDAAHR